MPLDNIRPPVGEPRAGANLVDPHGRTERDGVGPYTDPPAGDNPIGQRPASVDGPAAALRKRRVLDGLFPEDDGDDEVREPLKIGPYIVLEHVEHGGLIGRGGMGLVYAVWHEGTGRQCVAKLIRGAVSPAAVERAQREARLLAKFRHPNIVSVFDSGVTTDQEFFIIMEYVSGVTLDKWQREPRTWREVVEVYHLAGCGLAEAHRAGVLHRDFKPGNVMVSPPESRGGRCQVRVLDFGLAALRVRALPSEAVPADAEQATVHVLEQAAARDFLPHTLRGARLGTPGYIPPEQLEVARQTRLPVDVDERADQFSFCVSLYEALFGFLPFGPLALRTRDSASAAEALAAYEQRVLRGQFDTPPGLDGALTRLFERVLRRGLARAPGDRFSSMDRLLVALERELQRGERITRRLLGAGGVVLAGLVGAVLPSVFTAPADRCLDAGAALTEAWDGERDAAALRRAVPDDAVRDQVARRFDTFKAAWIERRMQVCEAAVRLGEAADLQGAEECLDDHLWVFRGTVQELLASDSSQRLDLHELADAVRLDACLAVNPAAAPALSSPEAAAQAGEIRRQLAESEANLLLGDYVRSSEIAADALRSAEALGDGPLLARALNQVARPQTYSLDRGEVPALLERAAALGERHRMDDLLVEIYLRQFRMAAFASMPSDATAQAYETLLQAAQARLGETGGSRVADAWQYRARLETSHGRLAMAEEQLHALDAVWATRTPSERARAHEEWGEIANRRGDADAARRHLRIGLRLRALELGESHPRMLSPVVNLAQMATKLGQYDEAADLLRRAALLTEQVACDPVDLTHFYAVSSFLAMNTGQMTEGSRLAAQGLALINRLALGDATRLRELELIDMSLVYAFVAGDEARVVDLAGRLLAQRKLTRTPFGPEMDYYLSRGGIAASELGRHDLAVALLAGIIPGASFRRHDVVDHYVSTARSLLAVGQPSAALAAAEDVLRLPAADIKTTALDEAKKLRREARVRLK